MLIFGGVLLAGLAFMVFSLNNDLAASHVATPGQAALLLLGTALLAALAFEFVNGFHDTANAVATVIYTNALPPTVAVVWSGLWNFLGVLTASGAVAYGIISLLPVELILQADSGAGFAMVFALLLAAIIWNLGTWWLGLPASSSHTLIGSIIGVGVANQLMHYASGTSGVQWGKAQEIGLSLLISPLAGFLLAMLVLRLLMLLVKQPALYREPEGDAPPPLWIRGILVLTCTLVSFFHGSNDGQKGMGLIMLILIGVVPSAYALDRSMAQSDVATIVAEARATSAALAPAGGALSSDGRAETMTFMQTRNVTPVTQPALAALAGHVADDLARYGRLDKVPATAIRNLRSDMYLLSESLALLEKTAPDALPADATSHIKALRTNMDGATRFIPNWVKMVVALALGLGTMVGWRRVVQTVGEKIGNSGMTYAQGATAQMVAAGMIGAASGLGLPVSTTHVLSSGVAGTMVGSGNGVQGGTVKSMALAWVLTLPVAMLLSGSLFWLFNQLA
ncbi:MAG: inorganic phosphate transporter [Sphingomonadales bacterium]